ncbi:hypothetical protein BH18ACI1_BH18ACI1_08280 [soil metagenome]
MKIEQMTLYDIESDIQRIEAVITTPIFALENHEHPLRQAAFTELIICLNDLLQKSKSLGVPVTFNDDVVITKDVSDITDAVNKLRNAICHISSPLNLLINTKDSKIKPVFGILYGKVQAVFVIAGEEMMSSDYEDDLCFTYGNLKLYLRRHIFRAFDEVKQNLLPLISGDTTLK